MTVEFSFSRSPRMQVAALAWKGPWNEKKIRSQFERVERWIQQAGGRTGRWVFREPGERSWEVAIEVKGKVRASQGIRLKTLPATAVARVVFDPDLIAPHVIYHGLSDWLRWRRRAKEIRSVGGSREVYQGNPWRDKRAWARTEIQFVVRR